MNTNTVIEDYIKTLTDKERIALNKARELLKDSFNKAMDNSY